MKLTTHEMTMIVYALRPAILLHETKNFIEDAVNLKKKLIVEMESRIIEK